MEEKIYCSHCGELIDTDDYGELDGLYAKFQLNNYRGRFKQRPRNTRKESKNG